MRNNISIDESQSFGCEIEFYSPYSLREINNYFHHCNSDFKVEYDMSSTDLKEAISPILKKDELHKLEYSLDLLKQLKSKSGLASAAHIHFDASIVKDDNLINMLKLWCISEEIIYDFSKGEFNELRQYYASYAARMKNDLTALINNNNGNLEPFKYFYKANGLNLSNHLCKRSRKDTYEVRTPNGTINYEIWLNNIDFFGNLLSFGNKEESEEIINFYYLNDIELQSKALSELIFDNEESRDYFHKQLKGYYVKTK